MWHFQRKTILSAQDGFRGVAAGVYDKREMLLGAKSQLKIWIFTRLFVSLQSEILCVYDETDKLECERPEGV